MSERNWEKKTPQIVYIGCSHTESPCITKAQDKVLKITLTQLVLIAICTL